LAGFGWLFSDIMDNEKTYPGGYSILKDHWATPRPVTEPEPLIRFETEPGHQMQADFATIRRGRDRSSLFHPDDRMEPSNLGGFVNKHLAPNSAEEIKRTLVTA
jgi:hypothetical protein